MPDSYAEQGFCRHCGEQGRVGAAPCNSCGGLLSTPQHTGLGETNAALGEYLQPSSATQGTQVTDAEWNQILDAVADFVNAQTWVASKLLLRQRRELLLTETADEVLAASIAKRQRGGNIGDVRNLEEHRRLLACCRREGIDAAFAERPIKKQVFLEWAGEWLIAIVILVLIIVAINLFI